MSRRRVVLPTASAVLLGLLAVMLVSWSAAGTPSVPALAETRHAHTSVPGDAADDAAIWVDGHDPAASLVIVTNKKPGGGLQLLDLDGEELQFLPAGPLNNVDLRTDVAGLEGADALVAATNRRTGHIDLFALEGRRLRPVDSLPTGRQDIYGLCLHQPDPDAAVHVFVTFEDGRLEQRVVAVTEDHASSRLVRTVQMGTTAEGCVADDEHETLFVNEEDRGLWRLDARADSRTAPTLIDDVGEEGNLTADVEGAALYSFHEGGYLLVSSQGDDRIVVYERHPPHDYVAEFTVTGRDGIDDVSGTDGVAITSAALSPEFPEGLVVVHDQDNDGAPDSNTKLVSWRDVADTLDLERPPRRWMLP